MARTCGNPSLEITVLLIMHRRGIAPPAHVDLDRLLDRLEAEADRAVIPRLRKLLA